jgi:hypothetical protein
MFKKHACCSYRPRTDVPDLITCLITMLYFSALWIPACRTSRRAIASTFFYYGLDTERRDLYIATLDPEAGKVLVPPARAVERAAANARPAWSADGQYLAYLSSQGTIKDRFAAFCLTDEVRCAYGNDNRVFQRPGRDSAASTRETPPDVWRAPSDQRDRRGPGPVTHQTRTAFSRSDRMAVPARMREGHGRAEAAPGGAPA